MLPIWNPSQKTQVKQIEQVQRNAARWVMNQPYSPHNPISVTEMLNKLKWPSLEQRRVWTDVTLMYKRVNCLITVPVNYHPTTATVRSTRRSHSMKFIPIQISEFIFSTDCHHLEHDTGSLFYLCESGCF